ncbi:MAG TPA: hypothetical protein DCX17_00790 [Firmicutes bacterium]|nr:hypothetical protein [Bacillota bacterium]
MKNNRKRLTIIFSSFFATAMLVSTISFSPQDVDALGGIAITSATNINLNNLDDAAVNSYYTGVSGLSGTTLKGELHEIVDDHYAYSYTKTPDIMRVTDRDWGLSPASPDANGYQTFDLLADDPYMNLLYGQYNGSVSTAYLWSADHTTIWNKEHTWAKSHGDFGETAPAGTDLHHLRASDQNNNLYHSNYDFGVVSTVTAIVNDERGNPSGKVGYASGFTADKVYEPRDEDKGDVARMIFYMATRYTEYLSIGEPMLRIIDELSLSITVTSSTTVYGEMGILSHLLAWNDSDPVSEYEIHRNNLIYNNFQGNRNPYIDHPEWVDIVYDPTYAGPGASIEPGSSSVGAGTTPTAPLSSIAVDITNADTSYYVGETFSTSGLIVIATYTDASSGLVTGFITSPADGAILDTIGTQAINVSYTKDGVTKTTSYQVQVEEVPIVTTDTVSITSTNVPGITTAAYALDPVTYTEATTGLSFTYYKMMKRSSTSLDLQCQGGTFYLFNNSSMANIKSLTLTYSVAPLNNFMVRGGTSINPTAGTIITPNINGLVYTYNFAIGSFPYFAITYAINVSYVTSFVFEFGTESTPPVTLSSIEATPDQTETVFAVNDLFTYTNLNVVATYSDSSTETITSYSVSAPSMTTSGAKTVTVTYLDKTDSYVIHVCALTSLSVTPTVTSISVGTTYSDPGITGIAIFSDGTESFTKSLTASNISLSNVDTSTTGTKNVTATYTYNGMTATANFSISVVAPVETASWGHTFTTISEFTSAYNKKPYTSYTLTDSTGVTGSVTWSYLFTAATKKYYAGYDSIKGVQLGSEAASYKAIQLSSQTSYSNVTKIVVETSGAASIAGTLKAYIGSTSSQFGATYTLTATNTAVTFTSISGMSGIPILAWSQTSAKAFYIKSITIYTT